MSLLQLFNSGKISDGINFLEKNRHACNIYKAPEIFAIIKFSKDNEVIENLTKYCILVDVSLNEFRQVYPSICYIRPNWNVIKFFHDRGCYINRDTYIWIISGSCSDVDILNRLHNDFGVPVYLSDIKYTNNVDLIDWIISKADHNKVTSNDIYRLLEIGHITGFKLLANRVPCLNADKLIEILSSSNPTTIQVAMNYIPSSFDPKKLAKKCYEEGNIESLRFLNSKGFINF